MPCCFLLTSYPQCFSPYPHQDTLPERNPVVMNDSPKSVDRPTSCKFPAVFAKFPNPVLESVDLRVVIQPQTQFTPKVFTNCIKRPTHLSLICAYKENIIGKAQIFHIRNSSREMIEAFQIEIEKPWTCIMSED